MLWRHFNTIPEAWNNLIYASRQRHSVTSTLRQTFNVISTSSWRHWDIFLWRQSCLGSYYEDAFRRRGGCFCPRTTELLVYKQISTCNTSAHYLLFGTSSDICHIDPRPFCLFSLVQKESKISSSIKVYKFNRILQIDSSGQDFILSTLKYKFPVKSRVDQDIREWHFRWYIAIIYLEYIYQIKSRHVAL